MPDSSAPAHAGVLEYAARASLATKRRNKMSAERCMCGAEDCKRCYPLNRQACEITDDDRAEALDTIVDEILDSRCGNDGLT